MMVKSGSGRDVNRQPIRICPGLQTGRIIRIIGNYCKLSENQCASIYIIKVLNSSKVNKALPTIIFQRYLRGFTPAFYSLPHWSELGGIICH
jgi:hypothetical protein